jgi:hypothetical protein
MGVPAANTEAVEDARRFGFPEEVVAAIGGVGEAGETEVWPENWEIVVAFVAVSTQWRAVALPSGAVRFVGLDYAAARVGLEAEGIAVTPELWRGIRVMEDAARAAANEGKR